MRTRRLGLLLAVGLWVSSLLPTTHDAPAPVLAQAVPGRIVAPASRQLAVLDLLAPRPRLLTSFEPPAYVTDVGVSPAGSLAVVAVARPFGEGGPIGGDLVRVDLASSQIASLVSRGEASVSLGAPAWTVDARAVVFERQDRAGPGIGYPGAASVASAHGLPWDVWVIGADDGTQLFVYGGTGSLVVDAASGEATSLTYLSGYGTTAWLPG